jgi:DNA-binding NarL/FixJ family response regulator
MSSSISRAPGVPGDAGATHAAIPPPATSRPPRRFRVFVVNEHTAERVVLRLIVRSDPALVFDGEAATTDEAMRMLDLGVVRPDVIVAPWLIDRRDPDAWAFVDHLRSRCPDARLVITCGDESPGIIRAAREHAVDVLHGTRDSSESLRRALHHAALERAYLSPSMRRAERRAETLTPRHYAILKFMAEGASRPDIARRLGVSESTVRSHIKVLFARLGVHERAHAVAVGIRTGLIV